MTGMAGQAGNSRPMNRHVNLQQGILTRGIPAQWSPPARWAGLAAIVLGAAMVAASALIHLHLWLAGYRHIHLIGPLFLAQAVAGIVLSLVIAAYRRVIAIAAGVLYLGGSVVALLISATVGFLGLHDGLGVPWAGASLATETVGLLALLCAGVGLLREQ
jgi:hypothetical protein